MYSVNSFASGRLSYIQAYTYSPRPTYYVAVLVVVCLYICTTLAVKKSISSLSGTIDGNPTHPPAREINVNGAAFQSTKNEDAVRVTDPSTRRTTTRNEDLCEEGYGCDGDIGPSSDAVLDEEDIEYYTKNVINSNRGRG